MSGRSLPPKPSIEQQKKLARDLLDAYRAGDADARERIRRHLPDKKRIALADAQFTLAREYGVDSWARLRSHIEAVRHASRDEATRERFRGAVHRHDAGLLRKLLEQDDAARALIDAPIFSFDTPALAHVAGTGDLAVVDVLLEFGADPNRRSDWWAGGWHPLHSARGVVAERLIAAGAAPDACAAAHLDRIDVLRSMLDADPARMHERGGDGQTPLHFAASRAIVDLLLERGADPDARDVDHRATPAQWMLERQRGAGRYELAAHLVERGAAADIFLAAALGSTDRLRELLERDASLLDARTGQGEYGEQPPSSFHIYTWTIGQNLSPLQVAAQFEQAGALAVLHDYATQTQRFVAACARGDAIAARALLRERPTLVAELTAADQRALPDAGWAPNARAVALTLELGFDAATVGSNGGNVLHCAAWEGDVASVEIALRYDAVRALIDVPDAVHGGTPLGWCCHGAAHCGSPNADHPAVARLLLAAGARVLPELAHVPPAVRAVLQEWQASH